MPIRVVKVNGMRTPEQRAGVCYVGRAFAGWAASPLANPFRPSFHPGTRQVIPASLDRCLAQYVAWLARRPEADYHALIEKLWADCDQGAKPLGCWCVDAGWGDGTPAVCHAQILAAILFVRFVQPKDRSSP